MGGEHLMIVKLRKQLFGRGIYLDRCFEMMGVTSGRHRRDRQGLGGVAGWPDMPPMVCIMAIIIDIMSRHWPI